jgi:hypothetical protein
MFLILRFQIYQQQSIIGTLTNLYLVLRNKSLHTVEVIIHNNLTELK